jgi:cysteine desulfurase
MILNNPSRYRYPLPHIAPIRVPGSFSLPLLIASAVALTETISESTRIFDLRNQLRNHLAAIPGVTVIGGDFDTRYLSIVVTDISGEEVLRALLKRGLLVDAGSACSPEDLSPSHVIAALGCPVEGHLRFTIHPTHQSRDIEALIHTFTEELALLRR